MESETRTTTTTTTEERQSPATLRRQIVIETRTLHTLGILLLVVAITATLFYIMLRLRTTYDSEQNAAAALAEVKQQDAELRLFRDQVTAELNALKATVYTGAGPKTPSASVRPSYVETWMRNKDVEYQRRLKALELFRYHLEER